MCRNWGKGVREDNQQWIDGERYEWLFSQRAGFLTTNLRAPGQASIPCPCLLYISPVLSICMIPHKQTRELLESVKGPCLVSNTRKLSEWAASCGSDFLRHIGTQGAYLESSSTWRCCWAGFPQAGPLGWQVTKDERGTQGFWGLCVSSEPQYSLFCYWFSFSWITIIITGYDQVIDLNGVISILQRGVQRLNGPVPVLVFAQECPPECDRYTSNICLTKPWKYHTAYRQ